MSSASEEVIMRERLIRESRCHPVFLSCTLADAYCNKFSNDILWPVLHYTSNRLSFDQDAWNAYKEANSKFADEIVQLVSDGDLIWIHDYHLMMLPKILRLKLQAAGIGGCHIGFFLHTPFPSSDILKKLPVSRDLIESLIHCDLIGFHTYDYLRHFSASCTAILGIPTMPHFIRHDGREAKVGVFPIGIEPSTFIDGLEIDEVQQTIQWIKEKYRNQTIMLGVERLDYIKGVPNKLIAFEKFLKKYPEFAGKILFIEIAVPSRIEVEEYKTLTENVNQIVGHINGIYGSIEYIPVHYLNKSVSFVELVALYAVSDICIISSLRDGMNLVAYEYVSSKVNSHGALIISEFAGAAASLNGSIIVNQWSIEDLVDAYYQAVTMPEDLKKENFSKLFSYVRNHTSVVWGCSFVDEFKQSVSAVRENQMHPEKIFLSQLDSILFSRKNLIIVNLDLVIDYFDFDLVVNFLIHLQKSHAETKVYLLLRSKKSHEAFIKLSATSSYFLSGDDLINNNMGIPQASSWNEPITVLLKWYSMRFSQTKIVESPNSITFYSEDCASDARSCTFKNAMNDLLTNIERLCSHLPVKMDTSKKNQIVFYHLQTDFNMILLKILRKFKKDEEMIFVSTLEDELNHIGEKFNYFKSIGLYDGEQISDAKNQKAIGDYAFDVAAFREIHEQA